MIYKIIGFICVGLGTIGVFLPILPTTPFLLLAMFCFAKASPKWKIWLTENRLLGSYIKAYTSGEGLNVREKIRILSMMWIVMGLSIYFFADPIWLKLLLIAIGIGVTIHISNIKKRQ